MERHARTGPKSATPHVGHCRRRVGVPDLGLSVDAADDPAEIALRPTGRPTGGPCTYTGRDMKTAHKGMNITDAQFNALVEDLKKTLDKFKVPEKEQGDLLAVLGPMKPQIVGQ